MGALVVEINMEPSPISEFADITLLGKAGEIMPRIYTNYKYYYRISQGLVFVP